MARVAWGSGRRARSASGIGEEAPASGKATSYGVGGEARRRRRRGETAARDSLAASWFGVDDGNGEGRVENS
jgi:hypothetical protein